MSLHPLKGILPFFSNDTQQTIAAIVLPPSVLTRLECKLWMKRMKVKTKVMSHHVFKTLIVCCKRQSWLFFLSALLVRAQINWTPLEWMNAVQPSSLSCLPSYLPCKLHQKKPKNFSQHLNCMLTYGITVLWSSVSPRNWAYSFGHNKISVLLLF